MLEGGEIKEEGTHSMLMKQKGMYADMYTKQAENYLATPAHDISNGIFDLKEVERGKDR